jgi:glucose-6-phosphate 1-epimerase
MTSLPTPLILTSADGAKAHLHPQGAHLLQWWPAGSGESHLFLSEKAILAPGVAVRGGVPVIFPQFAGAGPLPKHGFARTAAWSLSAPTLLDDGRAEVRATLTHESASHPLWPHRYVATLVVTLGGNALRCELRVCNTSDAPFAFTAALHTYLAVSDIADVAVRGLAGCTYADTADGGTVKHQGDEAVRFAGEVDRNYFATSAELTLHDGAHTTRIQQMGFADTVVWNPGAALCAGMKDLASDGYRRFVCVEAAAIQQPVSLAPGAAWWGAQVLVT